MKICVIGCGNMGSALVRGLRRPDVRDKIELCIYEPEKEKTDVLCTECEVRSASSIEEAAGNSDIIVLAVKPKNIAEACAALRGIVERHKQDCIVVSLVAGVSILELRDYLAAETPLVRVMPNLAAALGRAITGVYSEDVVARDDVVNLFSYVGKTVVLEKEDDIAIMTALGASAMGFVYEAIDAFSEEAQQLGLSRESAEKVSSQMVYGASALLLNSGESPQKLRDRVTTPGGTTAAGLKVLEISKTREALKSALEAATIRAREQMSK